MDSELFIKVKQREKGMGRIETFLIFAVASLYFAIVPGRIGTDELVSDPQLSGSFLEKGGKIPFAVGETVGKLNPIVGLDAFNPNAPAGVPLH